MYEGWCYCLITMHGYHFRSVISWPSYKDKQIKRSNICPQGMCLLHMLTFHGYRSLDIVGAVTHVHRYKRYILGILSGAWHVIEYNIWRPDDVYTCMYRWIGSLLLVVWVCRLFPPIVYLKWYWITSNRTDWFSVGIMFRQHAFRLIRKCLPFYSGR